MIKKIKLVIFNVLRHYVKNYITGNLGKVEEEDEYLVCYVNKRKIKSNKFIQYIYCQGIKESDKELAISYKLYKKIYYIFENLKFNNSYVTIFGYGSNSEIIIKNCKFNYGLSVKTVGKCVVDSCFIESSYYDLTLHARNLKLKNMDINNTLKYAGCSSRISFSADENLIIENCIIDSPNEKIKVFLTSLKKISLINVKIIAHTIKCKANKIVSFNHSLFKAKDKLEVDGEILNNLTMISPIMKVKDDVIDTKIQLIDILKNIRDKCISINKGKIIEYEKKLNNISVKKVLKK